MIRGKGIVVEIAQKNRVIVMTSQGEILRVPFNKQVIVGQEIQFVRPKRPNFWHWSVAAVIMLAIVGSAGIVQDTLPIPGGLEAAFFVTLDFNPSIELGVNREQRVVTAAGLNADGGQLLNKVRVVGHNLKKAVEAIGNQAELDGFLQSEGNEIIVTISCDVQEEPVAVEELPEVGIDRSSQAIQHEIEDMLVRTLGVAYRASVKIWQVPVEMRQEARLAGLTPGRYMSVYVERQVAASAARPAQQARLAQGTEQQRDVRVWEYHVSRPSASSVTLTRIDSPVELAANSGGKGAFGSSE